MLQGAKLSELYMEQQLQYAHLAGIILHLNQSNHPQNTKQKYVFLDISQAQCKQDNKWEGLSFKAKGLANAVEYKCRV